MFLSLLTNNAEKIAFIHMAVLLAISNIEDEENEDEDEENEDEDSEYAPLPGVEFEESKDWHISSKERAIIRGFLNELRIHSNPLGRLFPSRNAELDVSLPFNDIIERLSPVVNKISRLSEEEKRIEIIDNLVKEGIPWDSITDISPQSKRIIIIELLGVALVDANYTSFEKIVIESIAKKFRLDTDELKELADFVSKASQIYQEGIEIIQN